MKKRVLIITLFIIFILICVLTGLYIYNKSKKVSDKTRHIENIESKKEPMSEKETIEKILGLQDSSLVVKEYHTKKYYESIAKFDINNDSHNDVIEAVVNMDSDDFSILTDILNSKFELTCALDTANYMENDIGYGNLITKSLMDYWFGEQKLRESFNERYDDFFYDGYFRLEDIDLESFKAFIDENIKGRKSKLYDICNSFYETYSKVREFCSKIGADTYNYNCDYILEGGTEGLFLKEGANKNAIRVYYWKTEDGTYNVFVSYLEVIYDGFAPEKL